MEGQTHALTIGWDEYSPQVKDFPDDLARNRWQSIYNQYCILTENNKALTYYRLVMEINYYETRYVITAAIIDALSRRSIKEVFYDEMKAWRYKVNRSLSDDKLLHSLKKQFAGAKNTIELKRNELAQIKVNQEEGQSLIQQVVDLEGVLQRNEIDPKTTSVEKWVQLQNQAREKIEAIKKRNKVA